MSSPVHSLAVNYYKNGLENIAMLNVESKKSSELDRNHTEKINYDTIVYIYSFIVGHVVRGYFICVNMNNF